MNQELIVEKMIPGGQALATLPDGKKAFLWNALPGESIMSFEVTKTKSHYIEAIANKINRASKYRVEPKDQCYLSTSPWQIIDYNYELKLKQELVVELFREHGITINTPTILTDHRDYYYRNKMEYSLYWDNETNKISLAFHTRGSHRKTPIISSSIERPEIYNKAQEIINDLNTRHEEARKYQSLLLRCNQEGKVSGGLYENNQPHPTFTNLSDIILGHKYSYSPNGFFQINLPVYEMTLKEIKNHITTDDVLDLYSGVGTIGLSVASDRHLTLVECDKYAFAEMVKNISIDDVSESSEARIDANYRWQRTGEARVQNGKILAILSKSEEVTDYINHTQTVILDPPRAGCDKNLILRLNEVKPQKIVYLSCNPATQARDIKLLLDNYKISSIKTFNFFPRTPHIENLVILSL